MSKDSNEFNCCICLAHNGSLIKANIMYARDVPGGLNDMFRKCGQDDNSVCLVTPHTGIKDLKPIIYFRIDFFTQPQFTSGIKNPLCLSDIISLFPYIDGTGKSAICSLCLNNLVSQGYIGSYVCLTPFAKYHQDFIDEIF